ncbi:hypothetical protein A1O1_02322 [Capronia coronata CBS 617.96]|uniref:NAD(P)-binding protein n=1 Tax=Capronia coronata CBS 617.96 TaxID=1182541 RepID=W9ZHH7_9EURO|nr:uncharacterized protein A1O1_02322 [Capronia coronata CBS 617.96]EXJ93929.1 hypothetical protein A1O1_02322 [Capronia coronata CBS 617.96]
MPSYVVTGASRGIGYGFIDYLSRDPSNTVIGLVRNKAATDERLAQDGFLEKRPNITILQADIIDGAALRAASHETAKITGGSLDYLINNAAYLSTVTSGKFLDEFEDDDDQRRILDDDLSQNFATNVGGVIKTINAFLPLIKKSAIKKVISISTGMADPDLVTQYGIWEAAPYSMSKAAMNMAVAKYGARYQDEGILFLALSPGVVATSAAQGEFFPGSDTLVPKLLKYAPDFKGPVTPLESVEMMLKVVESASVANGDTGAFIGHLGNKQWL